MGTTPTWAYLKGVGRVRVLYYMGEGFWSVLDRKDERRIVHRDRLTFLKA